MLFGRPFLIWLILLAVSYNAAGTALNLGRAFSGPTNFAAVLWLSGALVIVSSVWLLSELWRDGKGQVKAAWVLFALMAASQIYAAVVYPFPAVKDLSPTKYHMMIYCFTAIMVAFYSLVPLYLLLRIRREG